eukprot:Plantae.Rhodophyta-Hildenbrandia_rubra.ctg42215.p1 GENE.Plantae.Rhodophyta-Hildenbrandia_rubra.ctg42215~~Plantae.Rhodophyta-Hildenbrandia_rubra.ctg42215.p1  ORF type:complete len:250 (+),score=44.15 Plantae.Rhodophyta-Hildenbrandia_rubra.ctg42215:176-925(+)
MLKAEKISESRWISALQARLPANGRIWAKEAFEGKDWDDAQEEFIEHFDAPAIKDKLQNDLSNIKKMSNESAQEYSDRFTSLMKRAGMKGGNRAPADIYINGLHCSLKTEARKSKAMAMRMLKASSVEPTAPIEVEAQNSIALDAAEGEHQAEPKKDKKSSEANVAVMLKRSGMRANAACVIRKGAAPRAMMTIINQKIEKGKMMKLRGSDPKLRKRGPRIVAFAGRRIGSLATSAARMRKIPRAQAWK